MKKPLAIAAILLTLPGCFSLSVPLGSEAKYGSITVGYVPPAVPPDLGGYAKLLKDK
jgi:hypothetical protein